MTQLTLFNVKTHSITTMYKRVYSKMWDRKVGDIYKTNNIIISIVDVSRSTPLTIIKRRAKKLKTNLGENLVKLGNRIK